MAFRTLIICKVAEDFIGGNLIDCIDLYFNLRNYISTDLVIYIQPDKIKTFYHKLKQTYTETFYKEVFKLIKTFNYVPKYDKYDLLIYRYNYLKYNPSITNYNSLLLNGWTLVYDIINGKNLPNIPIITTPFFMKLCKIKNVNIHNLHIAYHKLSKFRLDNIIIKNSGKYFYDYKNYEQLKSNKLFNIHQYDKLFYIRHKLTDMQLYMEMKGKLIFEFLYFGKKVHYSPDNKMFDDGLTDYFQLFNIDDNIEQDIHINKKEIYNKLIQFDDNDDYLKLINSL